MADIDLRHLSGDSAVIYFGGPRGSIDALTFANAVIALVDTARAVNEIVYPGEEIEIRLEAQADGSFKALLRRVRKGLPGFLARGAENLFWTFVGAAIAYAVLGDQKPKITINTDEVLVESGNDRIIVPREVHEKMPNVQRSPEVRSSVNQTFRIVQRDQGVTSIGITATLHDRSPALVIPRVEFDNIIKQTAVPPALIEKVRLREVQARLIILKAWLNHTNRKWSFEWNGVPVSAPIKDGQFLDQLGNREYLIGAGDALDVILMFKQNYIESLGVYENDPNSFVVKQVIKPIPRSVQTRL